MYVAGAAITQTGGHADMRARVSFGCACHGLAQGSILGRIADGVPDVRHAARDELRMGATHIKVMASGGAASPTDPIENTQYSLDELRAIVEEAEAWNTYVMGHAYTPRAIIRAIECGIRSIEHGNLLDETAATRMRELNAYLVPTLVSSDTLVRFGAELGSPAESMRKIRQVRDKGIEALDIARRCKTKIGFGTDILGMKLHNYQGEEFMLRSRVEDPVDTLISATSINAEMMMQKGRIGEITAGARADMLVVNGDPARDATTFNQQGANLDVVMKDGRFFKNTLC
jgi:imidazolonepropionase-like amidohydrolase